MNQPLSGWQTVMVFAPLLVVLVAASAVGLHLAVSDANVEAGTLAPKRSTTCWDGATAPTAQACAPLTGRQALGWVYPSFDPETTDCEERSGTRPQMWICLEEVSDTEVYVTYSEFASHRQGADYFDEDYGSGEKSEERAAGGRLAALVWDLATDDHHSRTVMYADAPYAVTVWAVDRDRADLTLAEVVARRTPRTLARRAP